MRYCPQNPCPASSRCARGIKRQRSCADIPTSSSLSDIHQLHIAIDPHETPSPCPRRRLSGRQLEEWLVTTMTASTWTRRSSSTTVRPILSLCLPALSRRSLTMAIRYAPEPVQALPMDGSNGSTLLHLHGFRAEHIPIHGIRD